MQGDVDAAISVAGVSYGAVLQQGAALLSLGSGAISGELSVDIQDASLGAYTLIQTGSSPLMRPVLWRCYKWHIRALLTYLTP